MTSFYRILSENFMDPMFLRQVREIGFLAQFESLLSSTGESIMHARTHTLSLTYIRTLSHPHTHTYARTHARMHVHTHAYTHIHTHMQTGGYSTIESLVDALQEKMKPTKMIPIFHKYSEWIVLRQIM